MGAAGSFPVAVLAALREEREIHVETSAGSGAPVHRTIIWIVVDDEGRALIRSYRGASARWYREATATGVGAIIAGGVSTPVTFMRADDAARVESCSTELGRKYAGDPATPLMLADDVLDTTLELRPLST